MAYKIATTDAEFAAGKAERRRAGVDARNARKLARITPRCRYIDIVPGGLCTAEAVDPEGEILLCTKHLGRAVELLRGRIGAEGLAGLITGVA